MEETTNKPSWEEKLKLAYYDIPTWMRYHQGINDGDTFTAEDVQEILQDYFNQPVTDLLTQREQEIESGIKKLTVVTYVGKGGIQYDRVLLDEVLTLLKKESNNNTKE